MSDNTESGLILHVIVVGFHHKKGCQVDYSYPPLVPGSVNECPQGWKYLPTLALPDGSHNFEEDTVYFHLPSLINSKQTVYGISCYRQIPVEKLKNRTSDLTRGTVQKSVCVLSKIPLYGQIQVKMSLITHAYFEEGDFSKVSLLEDTYHHLNSVLQQCDIPSQIFVGLSARDFILQWKHKVILLFKLILLEKRVMFFKSPVHPLCSTILTLMSLFPDMVESGLNQSASVKLSRSMSPMPSFAEDDSTPEGSPVKQSLDNPNESVLIISKPAEETNNSTENTENLYEQTEIGIEFTENETNLQSDSNNTLSIGEKSCSLKRDVSAETVNEFLQNDMIYLAQLNSESCGFPLPIFSKGYLCLPYLSLPYLDLLTDVKVRGYVVGATNVLFKQKRQLYDVLVDFDNLRIECQDIDLRKELHLTTEDLRFADFIVKHVQEDKQDVFLDNVGWEGGDEWIRTQFKIYLLCLLRTSMLPDGAKEIESFNSSFIQSLRETHNYKMWLSGINPGILDVNPGHIFTGQLSVADMKLRLSHTMQSTEGGRKLNQAMLSTGRAVVTTGKAVGGALTQAKGALSSWWNNLVVSPDPSQKVADADLLDGSLDGTSSGSTTDKYINSEVSSNGIPDNVNDCISNGNIKQNDCVNHNNEGDDRQLPGQVQII